MFVPGLSLLGLLQLRANMERWCHARGLLLSAWGPTKESLYQLWLRVTWKPKGLQQLPPAPPGGPRGPWPVYYDDELLDELWRYVRECRATGWENDSIVAALVAAGWPEDGMQRLVQSILN